MRIQIVAIGKVLEGWAEQGIKDYQGRFRAWQVDILALPNSKYRDSEKNKRIETALILSHVRHPSVVFLDKSGKSWDSLSFARQLESWSLKGGVSFAIGGAYGLAQDMIAGHEKWSLSALTFSHGQVRLLVMEQLYRGYSILHNYPYHK